MCFKVYLYVEKMNFFFRKEYIPWRLMLKQKLKPLYAYRGGYSIWTPPPKTKITLLAFVLYIINISVL